MLANSESIKKYCFEQKKVIDKIACYRLILLFFVSSLFDQPGYNAFAKFAKYLFDFGVQTVQPNYQILFIKFSLA